VLKKLCLCLIVAALLPLPAAAQSTQRDGSHDFDFEFGAWKTHLRRLVHPLTGSTTWTDYSGTSVVYKIWGGRANYGELEVDGPAGHIEGLTIRLYDPQAHHWNISFANAAFGQIGTPPMAGGFENGRGEFYDQETFDGRAIFARFIFSDITANTFRFEQSFSDDGGKTWEPNWIATFERAS
jgi:hypothetical protein